MPYKLKTDLTAYRRRRYQRVKGSPKLREYSRRSHAKARAKDIGQSRAKLKAGQLRRKYGLSLVQYLAAVHFQDGKCAACRVKPEFPETERPTPVLHIDHCHRTGKVRELLCSDCNVALGYLQEDTHRMLRLVDYTNRHAGTAPASTGTLGRTK